MGTACLDMTSFKPTFADSTGAINYRSEMVPPGEYRSPFSVCTVCGPHSMTKRVTGGEDIRGAAILEGGGLKNNLTLLQRNSNN